MYSMTFSVFTATVLLLFSSLLTVNVYAQTNYDCTRQCNDLRPEIISHEICRKARKTLPRPKVGDFCTNGMEQGFSDACMSLCMNERPLNRISAACRQAAMEMPRPTIRKFCEQGYSEAYAKTKKELENHFNREPNLSTEEPRALEEEEPPKKEEEPEPTKVVLKTIPVTLEDETTHDLVVYADQNAEEAVVAFCREKVPDDVSTCIRQLVPVVLEQIDA